MEEKEESSNISMLLTDLDSDILEVSSEGRWGVFYLAIEAAYPPRVSRDSVA